MPTRAAWLRLKAEECRVFAEAFRDGKARAELLILAQQYERLADQIERMNNEGSALTLY